MRRFSGTHTIRVAPDALRHFTPEGERAWAPGWDPHYPDGPPGGDGAQPGVVFTTRHGAAETIWVVLERDGARVRYARVTPAVWAGTVEVRVRDGQAEVTYELTALSDDGAERLEHFAARYEHEIGGWEAAIAAA